MGVAAADLRVYFSVEMKSTICLGDIKVMSKGAFKVVITLAICYN